MGYSNPFLPGGGSASSSSSPWLRSLQTIGSQPQTPERGQSRGRGFPERVQLTNPFHQASQTSADIFAAAGQLPAQLTETPVSLVDTASRRALGFSPIDTIGQIPGVGAAIGALGEGIERVGNFVPAILNAQDARMIEEFGDKPDDFELPWHSGQRSEGVPILGAVPGLQLLFSRAKTVGELKRELAQRGFLTDPKTGEQISWQQMVANLRSGQQGEFDFGNRSINDNPLIDLAGRIALDPTNALFLIPGINVAKGAQAAGKVVDAIDTALDAQRLLRPTANIVPALERAGVRAAQLPPPVVAKEAVAAGNASLITMRGMSSFLKDALAFPTSGALRIARRAADPRGYIGIGDGALTAGTALGRTGQAVGRGARGYAMSSAALSATMGVTSYTADFVDNALGGNTFFQGYHDFVLDVENNNPLSENAAWMLASAFSFPYGEVARGVKSEAARAALNAFGNDFEVALAAKFGFDRTPAGRQAFREAIGGPERVNEMIAYLLKHDAREVVEKRPLVGARAQSAPSAAVRARWADETLASVGLMRLRGNKVKGDRLVEMLEDWHAEQMGFKVKAGRGETSLAADPRRAPWVPELALRRWKRYAEIQRTIGRGLQEMADGVMGIGLRDYLFREKFSEIHSRLKATVGDDGIVPQSAIREILEENPALAISDPTGYWKNAALPDAKPLTWNSVRAKLAKQGKHASSLDDVLGEAAIKEQRVAQDDAPSAIEPVEQRMARLSDELDQHGDLDTPRAREIQDELARLSLQRQEVIGVKRFEADKLQLGQEAAETLARLEKQGDVPNITLDETTAQFDAQQRMIALEVERAILEIDPSYTVKALPKDSVLVQMRDSDPAIYQALKARTLLGELLFDRGPLAPFTGFIRGILKPVKGDRLARDARQALYERMIPDGAKPESVNNWIGLMQKAADQFSFESRGQRFGFYRDISSLPASAINKAAREAFGENSKIVAKWDGRFHDLLDRASSRFWRDQRNAARAGGRRGEFSRNLERFHQFYQEEGAIISTPTRLVGKTFYNLFRFLMDPRWIALNLAERNFLSGVEDGVLRGAKQDSRATAFYASGARRIDEAALANMTADTGWYYGRGIMAQVGRSFDKRRAASTIDTLNALGKSDAAALNTIRIRMRRQAEDDLAAARRAKEAGEEIDLTDVERRANLDIENSNKDLAVLLDEKLYAFDQKGVKRTIMDEANDLLDAEELVVMQPLLNALYEANEQMWKDVNRLYHGNPERNTLERLMNSYWLYWPISYQIKATKWLAGAMLDGSFGHNNNALLAGKYAVWQEQHQERLKNNPAYAAMFKENPDLWFAAGMVLPITPGDIGASLSRPVRLAGSWVGWFDEYKQAQGPASAAAYMTNLGPIYTWHLMQSIEADVRGTKFVPSFQTDPPAPEPAFNPRPSTPLLPAQLAPSTP